MVLLALAVLVGIVAGRARHPLGARSPRLTLSWLPLLAAGAVLNVGAYVLDGTAATLSLVASLAVLLGFTAVNAHVTGIAVVGVGLLVNLVAVAVNGGMPVRPSALVAAGVVDEHEVATLELTGARHLERDGDRLPVLGDALPLPVPVAPEVLSFGDLIVVVGAGDAVRDLARRRRPPWTAAEREAYRARLAATAGGAPTPLGQMGRPVGAPDAIDLRRPEGADPSTPSRGARGLGRPRVLVAATADGDPGRYA